MAQLVVRNIEGGVKSRLRQRARRHGLSMEAEVRDILRNAVKHEEPPSAGLGSEITSLFSGIGITDNIPELRRQRLKPPRFDE